MPAYDDVPESPQLPTKTTEPDVPITTALPKSVRRQLDLAVVVHETTLKAAVTEAVRLWLDQHPPTLPDALTNQ